MEVQWAEHDGQCCKVSSPPTGRDMVRAITEGPSLEQSRERGSPTAGESSGGKSRRNGTRPTRHHSTRGKWCEREDVGENLPCGNQRQRAKPAVPARRGAAVSHGPIRRICDP